MNPKVALKKYIDDIAVLAIEDCVVRRLSSLFDPEMVYDLSDDTIINLAAESEATGKDRANNSEKLRILQAGYQDLKRLDKHRPLNLGMTFLHVLHSTTRE